MITDDEMERYFLSQPKERAVFNYYEDEEEVPGVVYFLVNDDDRQQFTELQAAQVVCLYVSPQGWLFCNVCEIL